MALKKWADLHLTRVTSGGQFIPQIDGLRFVAIATVVLHHISNYIFVKTHHEDLSISTARYLIEGHWGVPLFFIISGFIVALPFGKHLLENGKSISLRDYFLRRITRLDPPYILCLLLLFPLVLVVQHVTFRSQVLHLIASIFYVHNLVYNNLSTINPVTWSVFLAIAVYIAAFLGPISSWVFSRPLLTITGGMCYTIYLYHSAVISAVGRHLLFIHPATYNQTLLLHAIVEIPPIALVSILLFAYVERPCMERDWPKRLLQRIKSSTPPESSELIGSK